jgi:hypothetical protein
MMATVNSGYDVEAVNWKMRIAFFLISPVAPSGA